MTKKPVPYKKAVRSWAVGGKADAFTMSSMLAKLYGKSKERTLDDLVNERKKYLRKMGKVM